MADEEVTPAPRIPLTDTEAVNLLCRMFSAKSWDDPLDFLGVIYDVLCRTPESAIGTQRLAGGCGPEASWYDAAHAWWAERGIPMPEAP